MSRLVTNAVLQELRTDPRPIGDAVAPDDSSYPYAVLYSLDVNDLDGDWKDIDVTGWHEFQVTSVGVSREQAQGLDDRLRGILLASSPAVTGYSLGPWRFAGLVGVTDRDEDIDPNLFYSITTFEVFVAPD